MRAPSGPLLHSGVSALLQLWQRPGGAALYLKSQMMWKGLGNRVIYALLAVSLRPSHQKFDSSFHRHTYSSHHRRHLALEPLDPASVGLAGRHVLVLRSCLSSAVDNQKFSAAASSFACMIPSRAFDQESH